MNKKLILIEENIFTEEIKDINAHLKEAIKILCNLRDGVYRTDYEKAIYKLDCISDTLEILSEKRFRDVKPKTTLLNYKYKIESNEEKDVEIFKD